MAENGEVMNGIVLDSMEADGKKGVGGVNQVN